MSTTAFEVPAPAWGLKEWSTVMQRAEAGTLRLLLRKGGLREPGFALRASSALLFPTGFHQQHAPRDVAQQIDGAANPRDGLVLSCGIAVEGLWRVVDDSILSALCPWTGLPEAELQLRSQLRPTQAMWLVRVRPFRLSTVMRLPWQREFGGCRSWVQLPIDGPLQVQWAGCAEEHQLSQTLSELVSLGSVIEMPTPWSDPGLDQANVTGETSVSREPRWPE